MRQKVADNLSRYDTPVMFVVTQRAARQVYTFDLKKKASGIDVQESELDILLEELIEREKLSEEEGNEAK